MCGPLVNRSHDLRESLELEAIARILADSEQSGFSAVEGDVVTMLVLAIGLHLGSWKVK